MSKLIERREELRAKSAALAAIFDAAGADLDLNKVEQLKGLNGTKAKADEVKRLNDELTELGKEIDSLAQLEQAYNQVKAREAQMREPVGNLPHPGLGQQAPQMKSIGELFVESQAFKGYSGKRGPVANVDVDMKTLMTQAAGWAPQSIRMPGYVPSAQRVPTVTDVIPMNTTTQAAITYMVETTFTNNAAERTEGANNAGEAALALTETSTNVRQIAVWLPVTDEQMADVSYISGYINNRLTLMLRQRMSAELLTGNGVPPNLEGLLVNATVQTQAKGADPTPDAIYKAMTAIRVTGRAEPNVTIWHPNDWQDIRLLRTADGIYIWGSPMDAGPERIWGLPVIQDTAETENTALVGDTNFCELVMRQNIEFEVSNSHASYFIQFIQAIRASVRAAFPIYRPTAFCKVTGI